MKLTPKRRWHLTAEEKREIARRTRAGERQSKIARALGIGAPSVSRAQRAMGLPTRLVIPEEQILELFRQGWGGCRISKALHVPVNQVFAVAHKNNFRRADKRGYPTPVENEARFIEAVRNREDYCARMAAKYGIGITKAQRLARIVLNTPRFRPGASKPALSSDFPQKHHDKKMRAR
jgi:transposase-like protein